MNVRELRVSKKEAQKLFDEYSPAAELDTRYASVANVASAILAGTHVLELNTAMREVGVDASGRPLLAIAPIGGTRISFEPSRNNQAGLFRSGEWSLSLAPNSLPGVQMTKRTFGSEIDRAEWSSLRSVVPMTPPRFIPRDADMSKLFVLWEAEWEEIAPIDPFLLEQIDGSFYAIRAQWDLTPVERLIIGESKPEDKSAGQDWRTSSFARMFGFRE